MLVMCMMCIISELWFLCRCWMLCIMVCCCWWLGWVRCSGVLYLIFRVRVLFYCLSCRVFSNFVLL